MCLAVCTYFTYEPQILQVLKIIPKPYPQCVTGIYNILTSALCTWAFPSTRAFDSKD